MILSRRAKRDEERNATDRPLERDAQSSTMSFNGFTLSSVHEQVACVRIQYSAIKKCVKIAAQRSSMVSDSAVLLNDVHSPDCPPLMHRMYCRANMTVIHRRSAFLFLFPQCWRSLCVFLIF